MTGTPVTEYCPDWNYRHGDSNHQDRESERRFGCDEMNITGPSARSNAGGLIRDF